MAKINNQKVMQKLIDELKLYPGKDQIPTEIADKILATYQVNDQEVTVKTPTANVVRHVEEAAGGTSTIYTTPATGKFYLTNVSLQAVDKKANGVARVDVSVVINEVTVKVAAMKFTQPATILNLINGVVCSDFQNPILLDAGSIVTVTSSDSDCDANAVIVGYTEE